MTPANQNSQGFFVVILFVVRDSQYKKVERPILVFKLCKRGTRYLLSLKRV